MANLQETARWEDGIFQIETTTPLLGGEDGPLNNATKNLANRTQWLKSIMDGIINGTYIVKKSVSETSDDSLRKAFIGKTAPDVAIYIMQNILPTMSDFEEKSFSINVGTIEGFTKLWNENDTVNTISDGYSVTIKVACVLPKQGSNTYGYAKLFMYGYNSADTYECNLFEDKYTPWKSPKDKFVPLDSSETKGLGVVASGGNYTNGWRKFADGTIEQWGTTGSAESDSCFFANFAIPYTEGYSTTVTDRGTEKLVHTIMVDEAGCTNMKMRAWKLNSDGSVTTAGGICYRCIGK